MKVYCRFHSTNAAFSQSRTKTKPELMLQLCVAQTKLKVKPGYASGPCNSFYCLGHSKNVYDNGDDDVDPCSSPPFRPFPSP